MSGKKWIEACEFHSLDAGEVLDKVAQQVSRQARPVVLLDLDSTLYEVRPRSHRILGEWAGQSSSQSVDSAEKALWEILLGLEEAHIQYSISDTFSYLKAQMGISCSPESLASMQQFWLERFFTSRYLAYDRPYAGAVEFVNRVHALGAEVIYLTGRDEPNMGDGTRANLLRDGFPWKVPRTQLLMKSAYGESDLKHKTTAAEFVLTQGNLVASFENEPPNVVALQGIFPEAMHIFVETVYSQTPALPGKNLYRIDEFAKLRARD